MTSTIISKGINKLSLNSLGPPTDEDFIRNIDYDELEKKFHVRKYSTLNLYTTNWRRQILRK